MEYVPTERSLVRRCSSKRVAPGREGGAYRPASGRTGIRGTLASRLCGTAGRVGVCPTPGQGSVIERLFATRDDVDTTGEGGCGYWASIPDLPGVVSASSTANQAAPAAWSTSS